MYRVLIVDDEMYAVMGLKDGVQWSRLGVSDVREAYNMRGAIAVFGECRIDVMICDIEMPKGTGIELLEWVREHHPDTEVIFLTAHADFRFMKRAIQLSSFDYMMKPIGYEVLEETLGRALERAGQTRKEREIRDRFQPYQELWPRQKTLLSERFWYDLLAKRITVSRDHERSLMEAHGVELAPGERLLPVLISVESWNRELRAGDEEILEYAIRQSAKEFLLEGGRGEVIQSKQGAIVAILYGGGEAPASLLAQAGQLCVRYAAYCMDHLNCRISCYLGEPAELKELASMYRRLLLQEYDNLSRSEPVNWLREEAEPQHHRPGRRQTRLPEFNAWAMLLEEGRIGEVEALLRSSLAEMAADRSMGGAELQAYYLCFLQVMLYVLQKKGLSAHELGSDQPLEGPPRSLPQLEAWALDMLRRFNETLDHGESVIGRLQAYIAGHLGENITREMLAEYCFLNPAYLSRLFKKETGLSITDYLLQERMRIAGEIIAHSSVPISEVARRMGYNNFSYFSKMFKKIYGVGPQQHRKLAIGGDGFAAEE
ncbi:response regulator [Paenibacillus humicus]|uniref:response regulator n=1 Tax=Paenibacillus humicus TaxID=412861 RepID=UPI000FD7E81F|nr:response regulator [Paenibacillus humicus]